MNLNEQKKLSQIDILLEPQSRDDSSSVSERDVRPVSVSVLVGHQLDAVEIFVGGGHDLHDVLVRLQPGRVQLVAAP